MKEHIRNWYRDNLFRNSLYLMLNTGLQAGLGFVFWLICARLFSPNDIGVATSLISTMSLISYVSLLGFNSTFVRFLPNSKDRSTEINTGLVLCISAAVVIATGYVFAVPYLAPRLSVIHDNIFFGAGFVVLVALAGVNLLTDSIFVAYRAAKYNLLIDGGIMGVIKMFLPFVFIGLGAYGVFAAAGSAAAVAMIASIIFLMTKFEYMPRLVVHWETIKKIFTYSFSNYLGNLFNIAPTLVLPLIVINRLGSANAGYYYLTFTVANLLYAIVYSVAQSLFAEGSYGETALRHLVKRSAAILSAIMIPSAIIFALFGPLILSAFGKLYSSAGSQTIIVFALAAPIVGAYTLGSVLLRIMNQAYSIVIVNIIYFVTISGLAVMWVGRGLIWAAISWLIGNLIAAIAAFLFIAYFHRRTMARIHA